MKVTVKLDREKNLWRSADLYKRKRRKTYKDVLVLMGLMCIAALCRYVQEASAKTVSVEKHRKKGCNYV